MANIFYYLGDFVSKPMQWDWMNSESPFIEWLCGINYNIYNWLMLTSGDFDKYGVVWKEEQNDKE